MALYVQPPSDVGGSLRENKRDNFLNYLLETNMDPKNHIPCYRKILSVRTEDSVPNALRRLSSEGFTSAPVLSENGFEGFIDMLDLVKFVTNLFWGCDESSWIDFWDKECRFQRATVADVMANRRRQASMFAEPVYKDNSTMHALELMVVANTHRVAVLDNRSTRALVGIFTQSMLLSELTQRMYMVGELRAKPVSDIADLLQPIETIKEDDKAINAFLRMAQKDIAGLAVVDRDGILTGAISITDLKCVGINGEYFARLFRTVRDYKQLMLENFPSAAPRAHYSRKPAPRSGLYVTSEQTFEDVIRLMDDGNIHRVFVCKMVRGQPIPQHVITQTDVLRKIWKHYTWSA